MIERGDVVLAAFPFVEQARRRIRPTLVVSAALPDQGLLWCVMITGDPAETWPFDIATGADFAALGLKRPSIVRVAKIAVVGADGAQPIGRAQSSLLERVDDALGAILRRDRS